MKSNRKLISCIAVLALFASSFFLGRFAAQVAPTIGSAIQPDAEENWGLSFQEEGKLPQANSSIEEMGKYNAYYAEDTQEKVLYLTFDCGFENGNTPAILDALKKHNAKAAFFVVGNYLETSPDLVKRMAEEGHIVGNHSYHHPDMSQMGKEEFTKELEELDRIMEEAKRAALPAVEIEPQAEETVDFDTFCKSDFRAVKVKDCQKVKKSDKLLRFTLDDGTGTDRQILSGIAKWYAPEDLMGKTLVAIVNLPPRKMMGLESCGMLISAVHTEHGEERLNLLMVDDRIPAGAKLC